MLEDSETGHVRTSLESTPFQVETLETSRLSNQSINLNAVIGDIVMETKVMATIQASVGSGVNSSSAGPRRVKLESDRKLYPRIYP